MKKVYSFLLVYSFLMFTSCKKDLTGNTEEETYLIKVKEYKTDLPLPAAKINLYACFRYDPEFGCQSTGWLKSFTTDNNGEYIITLEELNKADEGIILSKAQYWDIRGGTGENRMEPEAWANIHLKAGNAYGDTSFFRLTTTGELGATSVLSFKAPVDSTVNFRLIGNETNEITWVVYAGEICPYYCTRDTLASGTITLNPQKFETLPFSLEY